MQSQSGATVLPEMLSQLHPTKSSFRRSVCSEWHLFRLSGGDFMQACRNSQLILARFGNVPEFFAQNENAKKH
jgi:hypothetical protein